MSEIPVGTPPVPPGRHAAPGGWYADPANPAQERYWDGWQWSRNTRPRAGDAAPFGVPPQSGRPPRLSDPRGAYAVAGQPTTADGVPLAGWWWRVLATVIDNLLLNVAVSLLTFPITSAVVRGFQDYVRQVLDAQRSGAALPPQLDPNSLISTQDSLILVVVGIAAGLIYRILLVHYRGATIGKLACGLRVVPVDQGRFAGRLGWAPAAIRAVIWVVPAAVGYLFVVMLVDALLPLWQPKRQALHDLAARTQVVRPAGRTQPGAR